GAHRGAAESALPSTDLTMCATGSDRSQGRRSPVPAAPAARPRLKGRRATRRPRVAHPPSPYHVEAHVLAQNYHQNFNPTGHLWLSALLAALPLLTLLGLLGGLKWKAHWAGAASLLVALIVGVTAFKMPVGQALSAGVYGAARSVLLVLWITFNAIWIYNMTVDTGHFAVLRR